MSRAAIAASAFSCVTVVAALSRHLRLGDCRSARVGPVKAPEESVRDIDFGIRIGKLGHRTLVRHWMAAATGAESAARVSSRVAFPVTLQPPPGGQMTLQFAQVILQALSSFAIAGGLIFTAVQFRNARKAQLVANFSKLVELQSQLRYLRVETPSLASVSPGDVQNLHSEREIQEYFLNLIQLSLFEIAWYAHHQGQISDDYFNSWATRMWQIAQEGSFRKMVDNPSTKIVHDDFYSYVRRLIDRSSPPSAGR